MRKKTENIKRKERKTMKEKKFLQKQVQYWFIIKSKSYFLFYFFFFFFFLVDGGTVRAKLSRSRQIQKIEIWKRFITWIWKKIQYIDLTDLFSFLGIRQLDFSFLSLQKQDNVSLGARTNHEADKLSIMVWSTLEEKQRKKRLKVGAWRDQKIKDRFYRFLLWGKWGCKTTKFILIHHVSSVWVLGQWTRGGM